MSKNFRHCVLCNSYSNCWERVNLPHENEEVTICCSCVQAIQSHENTYESEESDDVIYTEFEFIEMKNNE